MAFGIELILGWNCEDFDKLPFKLPPKPEDGIRESTCSWANPVYLNKISKEPILPDEDIVEENIEETDLQAYFDIISIPYKDALIKAHQDACKAMNFEFIREGRRVGTTHVYKTPLGERELMIFDLRAFYFPGSDMGDRYENAIIGVGVSARYRPVFADWRDSCGAIEDPQVYPPTEEMTIARNEIVKNVKWFDTAKYYIKMIHY